MPEISCNRCGVAVSYKTRPPKYCLECAAIVRREIDAARKRKSRKKDKADMMRTLMREVDKCCQDWQESGPRRRTCPQHQTWRRMTKTVRITLRDNSAGSRHTKGTIAAADGHDNGSMPTEDIRTIGQLMSEDNQGDRYGARVARNPDDWWNDRELKFSREMPRAMDEPWFTLPTETTDQKFESIQSVEDN